MNKIITLVTITLLTLTLTSCETIEITCGENTILVDNVCLPDSDKTPTNPTIPIDKDDTDDTNDPIIPNIVEYCETSINDYDSDSTSYELIWDDEFDYEGKLDDSKWEYLIGNGTNYGIPGWGNNELQNYTDSLDNVEVKDGLLRITAASQGYSQSGFTSGRVRTMNNLDFTYGIVEVCAKMPDTLGTWPAIWMLPTESPYGGWPNGGEIDIMEAVGFETNKVHFNIHTKNDNWGTSRSIGSSSTINNIATEYHRYGVKWQEDKIIFYVDGNEQFTYTPAQDSYEYWPFNSDFHLILNIAIGGVWGGQRGIEQGIWDDSMYIDYVRVYQEN